MTQYLEIQRLYGITEPNGYTEGELEPFRERFGLLPEAFTAYYTQFGKDQRLNQTQDSLLEPGEIEAFRHDDYLIFYCENQRCCVWGIRKEDLKQPNPPVYRSEDEKNWQLEAETLTEFFTAMAYLQAAFALDYGPEGHL